MMKFLKMNYTLLLAAVFCLGLTACGGGNSSNNSDDTTAGDDWRNSAEIVGSGSITYDGEGFIDVLVTMDDNYAYFYLDEPVQELHDSVSFPMTISDATEYLDGDVSFDDINGDGASDVSFGFVYAPGDSISLVWIWDQEKGYVFQEDMSVTTRRSGDLSEYLGLWKYADENLWLDIYDDETWAFFNEKEKIIARGTLSVDETGITLYFDDSDEVLQLDQSVSGDLLDSEKLTSLFPVADIQSSLENNN